MKEQRNSPMAREQLDHSLSKLKSLAESRRPVKGWLRAIRSGLGMPGVELAKRLGVTPPRVVEMEKKELDGGITLKVLERAAEAMGCDLVYALIPRAGSLERTLREKPASGAEVASAAWLQLFDPGETAKFLSPEECGDLRLAHLSTREELRRWESQGIQEAAAWAFARTRKDMLSEPWIRRLHGRMFARVWKGAGEFRISESAQGAPVKEIAERIAELCGNVRHWAKAGVHAPDEACARFHHRLAAIHPFARGNGNLARLMADLISVQVYGRPRFTWGAASGSAGEPPRKRYQDALRAAGARDYQPLALFMRS